MGQNTLNQLFARSGRFAPLEVQQGHAEVALITGLVGLGLDAVAEVEQRDLLMLPGFTLPVLRQDCITQRRGKAVGCD